MRLSKESLPVAQSLLIKDFTQAAELTDKVLVKKSAAVLNHSDRATKSPPGGAEQVCEDTLYLTIQQ